MVEQTDSSTRGRYLRGNVAFQPRRDRHRNTKNNGQAAQPPLQPYSLSAATGRFATVGKRFYSCSHGLWPALRSISQDDFQKIFKTLRGDVIFPWDQCFLGDVIFHLQNTTDGRIDGLIQGKNSRKNHGLICHDFFCGFQRIFPWIYSEKPRMMLVETTRTSVVYGTCKLM